MCPEVKHNSLREKLSLNLCVAFTEKPVNSRVSTLAGEAGKAEISNFVLNRSRQLRASVEIKIFQRYGPNLVYIFLIRIGNA